MKISFPLLLFVLLTPHGLCAHPPKEETTKQDFVPAIPQALANRIIELKKNHQYTEALQLSEEYIRLAPRASFGYNSKAQCLKGLGRISEAILYYRKALEFSRPHEKWACYSNMANAYFEMNDLDNAIAYFRFAIDSNSAMRAAFNLRIAVVLLAKGEYDEARKYYNSSVASIEASEISASKTARSNAGVVYGDVPFVAYNLGDNDNALRYARKYMEDYGSESAKLDYAICLALAGNKREALHLFESIDRTKCNYYDIAELYVIIGENDKAAQYFDLSYQEAHAQGVVEFWKIMLRRKYPKDVWKPVRNEPWFRDKVYSKP